MKCCKMKIFKFFIILFILGNSSSDAKTCEKLFSDLINKKDFPCFANITLCIAMLEKLKNKRPIKSLEGFKKYILLIMKVSVIMNMQL
jgi:hypothetical protein